MDCDLQRVLFCQPLLHHVLPLVLNLLQTLSLPPLLHLPAVVVGSCHLVLLTQLLNLAQLTYPLIASSSQQLVQTPAGHQEEC